MKVLVFCQNSLTEGKRNKTSDRLVNNVQELMLTSLLNRLTKRHSRHSVVQGLLFHSITLSVAHGQTDT
jgi:hypothetical protein